MNKNKNVFISSYAVKNEQRGHRFRTVCHVSTADRSTSALGNIAPGFYHLSELIKSPHQIGFCIKIQQ